MSISKLKNACSIIILITVCMVSSATAQPQDIYKFSSPEQQQQFSKITTELRCLVCQNESLADSTAPLAQDLRAEVYHKIQQGADDKTIKQYLVARYGQFILFKPAFNMLNFMLWFGPFLLLIIAIIIFLIYILRHKSTHVALELSPQEKQRLQNLLEKNNL